MSLKILLLIASNFLIAQCYWQSQNDIYDRNQIMKRRQDHIDMCRAFNADKYSAKHNRRSSHSRGKREVGNEIPRRVRRYGRRRRVEIADNINEALKPHEQVDAMNTSRNLIKNLKERRFDFRPAELIDESENSTTEHTTKELTTTDYTTAKPTASDYTHVESTISDRTTTENEIPNDQTSHTTSETRNPEKTTTESTVKPTASGTTSSEHTTIDNGSGVIQWPRNWKHGIIPYFIDPKTYDSQLSDIIVKAFDYFEKSTCIRLLRLREKPVDKESLEHVEWIYITNPLATKQCVHSNDQLPNVGVQIVVFGYDCLSLGEIVHEVMHILGFPHEHTRLDRDQYVTVLWDNIKPGYRKYFERRHYDHDLLSIVFKYDYSSVMHYPPKAFTKNGQTTIYSQSNYKIGQRDGLSETDVMKVDYVYGKQCDLRNKEYLETTCPFVLKPQRYPVVPNKDIDEYFKGRLWNYGIVNYDIKDQVEFSVEELDNIHSVMRYIEGKSCIEFRNIKGSNERDVTEKSTLGVQLSTKTKAYKTTSTTESLDKLYEDSMENAVETDHGVRRQKRSFKNKVPISPMRRDMTNYIELLRSSKPGCKCPEPGRGEDFGAKKVELNTDCFNSPNDLLHVFMHVLGLDHQHNMHDRDSFIVINWHNLTNAIENEMKHKLPPPASVNFAYDYRSIMHYPWLQIKGGISNIMYPIWDDGWIMGHWQGLSSIDVQKLNKIYQRDCLKRKVYLKRLSQNQSASTKNARS